MDLTIALCSFRGNSKILATKPSTLPLLSLLIPTSFTKSGGGGGGSRQNFPSISKTVAPMNVEFVRHQRTSLNVSEMLRVVYIVITWLP